MILVTTTTITIPKKTWDLANKKQKPSAGEVGPCITFVGPWVVEPWVEVAFKVRDRKSVV